MTKRFDVRDFDEIRGHVVNFTEGLSNSNESILCTVEDFFSDNYYEQIKVQTDVFIDEFNHNFKQKVLEWLEDWKNGDSSLIFLAEKIRAGEGSVERASEQQSELVLLFEEVEMRTEVITTNLEDSFDNHQIYALGRSIKDKSEEIRTDLQNIASRIDEEIEQNQFYLGISQIITPTIQSYINFIDSFGESIIKLSEKVEEVGEIEGHAQGNKLDEATSELHQKTQNLSEELIERTSNLFDIDDF